MKYFIKIIAIHVFSFVMCILQHIIPVKNNQIVFISNSGNQYSCNPKYISKYINRRYKNNFEIVWLFRKPKEYYFLRPEGIKVAKFSWLNRLKYGLTAKIIIINSGGLFYWIPLRERQLHINTWHGGGFYKLTGASENMRDKFYKECIALGSKNTSCFLSTNKCFTDNELRHDLYYSGKVLNIGFPRNDIFFHGNADKIRSKVCNYYSIDKGHKILLYAPTYRQNGEEIILPNFQRIKEAASERFGGEWVVFTRTHPNTKFLDENQDTIDASYQPNSPDMQELLMACDILISDYSSCIWDYSFTYRPCFLYTPDLEEYTENRGFGIDIHEWGFPVCETDQKLWDAIEDFEEDNFKKAMEKHHETLGSFEQGNACKVMGELIYNFCLDNNYK